MDAVSSCGASRRKGYAFGAECVEIDELESSSAMAAAVIEGTGDGKRGQVKGWQGGCVLLQSSRGFWEEGRGRAGLQSLIWGGNGGCRLRLERREESVIAV